MVHVEIPINENDLEMFKHLIYNGMPFSWTFPDSEGRDIDILFYKEEDDECA
jgi:hypothetical protein